MPSARLLDGAERADGTGVTVIFHRLEQRLGRIPLEDLTFVRSAEHMQNWSRSIPSAAKRGVLPSFHDPIRKPFPTVWAPDVGRVAAGLSARSLARTTTPRIPYVEGPRRYSATEVADTLATLLGRPVVAQAVPREHWLPALVGGGLSESYARLIVELYDTQNAGGIEIEDGVAERGRGATTLAEGLARITEWT
jgi:NAD(P)H dehydrogenase (quinone)